MLSVLANARHLLRRSELGLLVATVVVVLLAALVDPQHTYFVRPYDTGVDIVRQTSLLGIFTLGAAIVIIAGGIDLSSGAVIAFSGTICAIFLLLLWPEADKANKAVGPVGPGVIALAIAGTLLVGFLIGSMHAWLITVVRLPPFIATLASLVGLRSLARTLLDLVTFQVTGSHNTQINISDRQFRYLADSVWIPAVLCAVLAVLAWLLLSRTVVGRHLYALGGNEQAARLSGIRTDRLKWLAYCLSAMLSSLAGILYAGAFSVAEPSTQGLGYELNAIAAAVVGGCSLTGGVGTILGAVLGALFLRVIIDAVARVIKENANLYEGLMVGSVVLVAVALTQLRQVSRRGERFFAGALGAVAIANLTLLAGVLAAVVGQKSPLGPLPVGGLTALVTLVLLLLAWLVERRRLPRPADKTPEEK
jgi:ribose/xylose/arabinose/galactoside ABC-type transport system permease subunit